MEEEKRRVVLDTNVLISSLINPDSIAWEIFNEDSHKFLVPEMAVQEVRKYKELVEEKISGREEDFNYLISILFENIDIVQFDHYSSRIENSEKIMSDKDPKDVEFIALALQKDAVIWTDDQDFQQQGKVEVKTSEEIIDEIKDGKDN